MSSLTRWVLAHKRTVVIAWILLTFAGIAASGPPENLEAEFSVPDKEGWETNELIAANYQGTGGDTAPLMPVTVLPEGERRIPKGEGGPGGAGHELARGAAGCADRLLRLDR